MLSIDCNIKLEWHGVVVVVVVVVVDADVVVG